MNVICVIGDDDRIVSKRTGSEYDYVSRKG